ncbi:MAG: D-alanyl-lipoteichoic acid biosynthesis protein DltD [Lactobacillaceae bacterium]|jgi:D-alanine transfer protein|nr:D-alanyl-lipoteichoic acid biosynthesis protein DltD [Lactobacillaceae bacterium]
MFKRLWLIFGPVLVAGGLLVGLLLIAPTHTHSHSEAVEKRAATALTATVFKNAKLKRAALSDKKHRFVPFFGSSEWNRMDAFHPFTLAEKYHRNYRPFLLGERGAQSLTQFYGMQQTVKQMKNKQAVYFISPQWFMPQGEDVGAFTYYLGTDQIIRFLSNQTETKADQYAAKRYLQMVPSSTFGKMMKKIAKGQLLSKSDRLTLHILGKMMESEDNLFANFQIGNNYTTRILPKTKQLPKTYNVSKLQAIADKLGARATGNNDFGIENGFYNTRVRPQLPALSNSQVDFNYLQSPEYADLQLALTQMAQTKTSVMFVIPPVNEKWEAYTNMNLGMYNKTVEKIKYQLHAQGFNNIADFSQDGNKAYFMQDTIHMGWRGWIAFDEKVAPFLQAKYVKPQYAINNKFLKERWNQFNPTDDDFSEYLQLGN